jgi:UDP-2,3-diacylglucosamine hydrolase
MREKSRQVTEAKMREKTAEIMDVNDDAVRQAMRSHGVRRLIHGHTHRPGRHAVEVDGQRCERWVLPDWYGRGGYLQVDRDGPRLVRF